LLSLVCVCVSQHICTRVYIIDHLLRAFFIFSFFFFNATATPEIYTLSLHDALPISAIAPRKCRSRRHRTRSAPHHRVRRRGALEDRKSTRLNSSHLGISYAVFCLKKKKI